MTATPTRPLAGVEVLDLSRVLSGPYCSMLLADLGADVIKVEAIGGGDSSRHIGPYLGSQSHYFLSVNRNKRSIALDLHSERGRAILRRLVTRCDVLLENFRPGVLDELGLAVGELHARQPGLIVCSISGYGQDGPLREGVAFDVVVQAMSGLMSVTGTRDGPPVRLGVPMSDIGAGMFAALQIVGAVRAREMGGAVRQHLDVSMLDSSLALLTYIGSRFLNLGETAAPEGSGHHSAVPYGAFDASDGPIVIAVLTDSGWERLCRVLGLESLLAVDDFRTYSGRSLHRDAIEGTVAAALTQRTVAEWCELLTTAGVPAAPVLDVGQALTQAQVKARDVVETLKHPDYGEIRVVGSFFRQAGRRREPGRAPPVLGEHTRAVLTELGLAAAEIDELRGEGVVQDVT